MGLLRILFRRNRQVMVVQRPNDKSHTSISSVRRKYLLLGKEYSVTLIAGERNSLKIDGDTFRVTMKEMTRENFETFIEGWYKRTARKVFQQSIDRISAITENAPQIKIYKMRRAWGRCYYQKNIITLNLHLVKTPLECVDYIILHEMCHFTHHNHGKDFHAMVSYYDPNWKDKDKLLKEFAKQRATLLQRLHI